jgi:hypothetical protein
METLGDHEILEICQEMSARGDYQSLLRMLKLNRRINRVCQASFDQVIKRKEQQHRSQQEIDLDLGVFWDIGHRIDWREGGSPQRVLLWGKGPYTIHVFTEDNEDDEDDEGLPSSFTITGPVTIRKFVDHFNRFVRLHLAVDSRLDQWFGPNVFPVALNKIDDHSYSVLMESEPLT